MANSIFTNPSAFQALRALNSVNRRLDITQNRVSTGLKVSGALDDASAFSVAQGIRSELRAIESINQGLNNARALGKVAITGATAVSNVLIDVRQKLTELANATNSAAQFAIIKADFDELLSQAGSFIQNAQYNGVNLLTSTAASVATLANISGTSLTLSTQLVIDRFAGSLAGATLGTAANAQSVLLAEYATFQTQIATSLGTLGSEVNSLELQTTFLSELRDISDEGLGNIVDADLARESARLTSQQIQQELAVQTLSIANDRPQTILGLFRR
jgi:flagellin